MKLDSLVGDEKFGRWLCPPWSNHSPGSSGAPPCWVFCLWRKKKRQIPPPVGRCCYFLTSNQSLENRIILASKPAPAYNYVLTSYDYMIIDFQMTQTLEGRGAQIGFVCQFNFTQEYRCAMRCAMQLYQVQCQQSQHFQWVPGCCCRCLSSCWRSPKTVGLTYLKTYDFGQRQEMVIHITLSSEILTRMWWM